jgi:hypothetical protein
VFIPLLFFFYLLGYVLCSYFPPLLCREQEEKSTMRNLDVIKEIQSGRVERKAIERVDANEAVVEARLAEVR